MPEPPRRPRVKLVRVIIKDSNDRETTLEIKGRIDEEGLEYLIENLRSLVAGGGGEVEEKDTYYSKLKGLVLSYFRNGYFTSMQVRELYKEMYGEDLKLTTVSTYLGRMVSEGVLERIKHGKRWIYGVAEEVEAEERGPSPIISTGDLKEDPRRCDGTDCQY